MTYITVRLLERITPLRVPADHEDVGLNLSEHGEVEDYEVPEHVLAEFRGTSVRKLHSTDRE